MEINLSESATYVMYNDNISYAIVYYKLGNRLSLRHIFKIQISTFDGYAYFYYNELLIVCGIKLEEIKSISIKGVWECQKPKY